MQYIEEILHIISIFIYFVAFIVILQFYFKLKGEKYWIGFPLAILAYLFHELFEMIAHFTDYNTLVLAEVFEIVASVIFIISVYGLSREMSKIHKIENSEEQNDNN